MAGRPRKPIEEHLRDGTVPEGGTAHSRPTIIAGREKPKAPPGLDADAKAVWTLVVDDLFEGNVLDGADWPAVEEFAVMVGRARQARRALEFEKRQQAEKRRKLPELLRKYDEDMRRWREGDLKNEPTEPDVDPNPGAHLTQQGQKGSPTQSVYLQVEREAWREARQVGDGLGLSPKARAGLGLKVKGAGRKQGQDSGRRGVPERQRGGLGLVQGGRAADGAS